MQANYFFIDGSALTAQIRQLQRAQPSFQKRKLCPRRFVEYWIDALPELHGHEYKRITFYFPRGDEVAIHDYLDMPDFRQPGEVRDIHFKFCGQKLKKSAEFEKFVEEHVPAKFKDRFAKSEKGIDIEMCCDGLKLASGSRIERLFLLSNDGDFIAFCRSLKEFGANISILHLSDATQPNDDLLREADSYDIVPIDKLQDMFVPTPATMPALASTEEAAAAQKPEDEETDETIVPEKPVTEPSDLKVAEGAPAQTSE